MCVHVACSVWCVATYTLSSCVCSHIYSHTHILTGKSALIVFEDADVAGAVDWIITGMCMFCVCLCALCM